MIAMPSPFARFGSRIIGLPEIMESTAMIPLEETPTLNDEGWDTMTITYATKRASLTAEELAAAFPLGTQLGTRKWWVTGSKPQCVALGLWKAEVSFKGWGQSKPAKFSTGSAAEQHSAENVGVPGFMTPLAKVEASENTPTMRFTYLVEDYTDAPTDEVGRAKTPPEVIAVAASIWSSLADPVYHYPNGWVLMGSNVDRLTGAAAALVSDDYKYVRDYSP